MGTRSAIGIRNQDGSVDAVYCHWDGYLSNNGRILQEHYDRAKTAELISMGDLSSLRPDLGEQHDFEDRTERTENWCKFYHRDRGEELNPAQHFASPIDYLREFGGGIEYWYLLEGEGLWRVSAYQGEWRDLFEAIQEDKKS